MLLLCALIVGTSSVWADEVTFTPGTDTGETSVTKSGVTCTMTTMNHSSYYQIYANQSGTFACSSGNITKIEFTCTASGTSKYGPGNASANVGSYSYSGTNGTWTGEATSVTISSTAQVRMSSLTITYTSAAPAYSITAQSNNENYGTVSLTGSVITANPADGYTYASPAYTVNSGTATVDQNGNSFTVTPSTDCTITINFEAIPTHAITCVASPNDKGTISPSPVSAYEGQIVTLSYSPEVGYELSSIVITKTSDGTATGITPAKSGDDYTFTMPGYAVTATATFEYNLFEGSFAKVTSTSALEDGEYYVIYSTKAMNSTVTSGKMGAASITINNDIIENPDKSIVWKFVKNGDYWDLYNEKTGKYCYIEGTNTSAFKIAESASYHFAITTYATGGGFKFKTTHSSGRGIAYGNNDFGSYAESNNPTVYLYKYTVLTERTITFNGNGGTYNEETTYTQNVYDGVKATLDVNQFTRNGYAFVGWNTEDDGNGDSYYDEDNITVTGSNLTLYAQWAPLYSLTIDDNIDGGSVSVEGDITSATAGTEITLSSSPTVGHAFSAWNVYKADDNTTTVTVTDNKFDMPEYNVFISAIFEEGTTYTLVNSVDALYDGMKCVIVNEDGKVSMSTTQNTNNRGQVNVASSINTTDHILANPPATTQEIILEYTYYNKENPTYGWAFNVGTNTYLYAASSNSNHLKTTTFSKNSLTDITFSSNNATILFKGDYTINWIKYNSNSSIFSCYPSNNTTQAEIQLYKKNYNVASHVVELSQGEWGTFCPSVDVQIPEGINAYYATYADNTLTAVLIESGKIKEGEGVLLKATSNSGSYTFNATTGASRIAANKLMGRVEGLTPNTSYFTYYVFTGTGFARYENTIPANKAYFRVNGAYNPASAPSAIRFEEEVNNATDIKSLNTNENVAKFIENGQILIKKNGIVYDALGRVIRK